ncbi:MAG: ester cyclase [Chlamydiales bacterium]|nr:ester cyclase [Chlamydiia bacterium]MCP5504624.1 ester cyclase [Chlamydiales bacterium]
MKKLICILALMASAFATTGGELSHIITPRGGIDPQSENKALVKEFYDAFAKNDPRKMNELLTAKYGVQDSTVVFDSTYSKYDAFSKNLNVRLRSLHQALPEFKLQIIEMMAEGNKVLARIQIQGVQRGSFLGIEPTDKPVVIKIFAVFTIEGGKISHMNEVWNELGVMKQIGYIVL